jgi:hypothetical protein
MALNFSLLKISRQCVALVNPFRFCEAGADGFASQANAATDKLQGISDQSGGPAGGRFELEVQGLVPIEYGGNVANGDFLRSDANGKAIVATAGQRYGAIAFEDGDDGTIGSALIQHGIVDTP